MAPSCSRTMVPDKALRGTLHHGQHCGLRSLTLVWLLESVWHMDINMASGYSIGHGHLHELLWLIWAMNINPDISCIGITDPDMTLGGCMDHCSLLRRSNPKSEPFLILGLHRADSKGDPAAGLCVWGLSLHLWKLQAATLTPQDSIWQWLVPLSNSALSNTCYSCCVFSSASLHIVHAALPSFSPLHHTFVCYCGDTCLTIGAGSCLQGWPSLIPF